MASLKRLDVHTYTAVARWAQDDGGAAAAAHLPPGRRTHEEDALRRSIAALDQQLAALQVCVCVCVYWSMGYMHVWPRPCQCGRVRLG